DPASADGLMNDAGDGNQKRHVYVLVVKLERVAVVALVLSERLSVIAQHDPDGISIESPRLQAAAERAERGISVIERVAISAEFVAMRKGARRGRFVRMMAGDWEIRDEERPACRFGINPAEDIRDSGWLVDPEAGIVLAADISRVRQYRVASVANHRVHSK